MQCELNGGDSPDPGGEQTPTLPPPGGASSSPQDSEPPAQPSTGSGNNSSDGPKDNIPCLQYGEFLSFCKKKVELGEAGCH